MATLRVHEVVLEAGDPDSTTLRVHGVNLSVEDTPANVALRVHSVILSVTVSQFDMFLVAGGGEIPSSILGGHWLAVEASYSAGAPVLEWEWDSDVGDIGHTLDGTGINVNSSQATWRAPTSLVDVTGSIAVRARTSSGWTPWQTVEIAVAAHQWWLNTVGEPQPVFPGPGPAEPTLEGDVPVGDPDEGLWFTKPSGVTDKLLFAHYFPPFPLGLTPTSGGTASNDYYESNYLAITGESGTHASYGGYIRDRPVKLGAPWPGSGTTWMVNAARQEVRTAKKFGLDGFLCDTLGSSGNNWTVANAIFDAAVAEGNFYVIPMIDYGGGIGNGTASAAATAVNTLLNKGCALIRGGKYVVAAFRPEQVGGRSGSTAQAWWNDLKTALLSTHGKQVEFWHCFLSTGSAAGFAGSASPQTVTGSWDPGADPAAYNGTSWSWCTQAVGRGEDVLFPVWYQDVRPSTGHGRWFDEALNSQTLRTAWTHARNVNPKFVQMCTWNDYSEGSAFNASRKHGQAVLAMSAYHMYRWKYGAFPTILRDAVFVSHRNQLATTTITGGQTLSMSQNMNRVAESPVRYHVEVVTYLTAPDTVTVTISGTEYTYNAPAGEYVWSRVAAAGSVSVETGRGETVSSPVAIRSSTGNQDRDYCWAYNLETIPAGSTPTTLGDPTPAS